MANQKTENRGQKTESIVSPTSPSKPQKYDEIMAAVRKNYYDNDDFEFNITRAWENLDIPSKKLLDILDYAVLQRIIILSQPKYRCSPIFSREITFLSDAGGAS